MSKIYLIPNTLGENNFNFLFPENNSKIISNLKFFFVENIKESRRFLKKLLPEIIIDELTFIPIEKGADSIEINKTLSEIKDKNLRAGIISDAGCPGIADPGASIVELAHNINIRIVPLIGPSSMFLALMASGLNGQGFHFHGYLPKDRSQRLDKIKNLENATKKTQHSQLFMDTPYRNNHVLEDLIKTLSPQTKLCIACDITLNTEFIKTQKIQEWKKSKLPDLNKRPTVFIIG